MGRVFFICKANAERIYDALIPKVQVKLPHSKFYDKISAAPILIVVDKATTKPETIARSERENPKAVIY